MNGSNALTCDLGSGQYRSVSKKDNERIIHDMQFSVNRIVSTSGMFALGSTFWSKRGRGIRFGQLGMNQFRECTGFLPKTNNAYIFVNVPDFHNIRLRLSLEVPSHIWRVPLQLSWATVEKITGSYDVSYPQKRFVPPFDHRAWTCFRVLGKTIQDNCSNVIWATLFDAEGLIGSRPFMLSYSVNDYASSVGISSLISDLAVVDDNRIFLKGIGSMSREALIETFIGLRPFIN